MPEPQPCPLRNALAATHYAVAAAFRDYAPTAGVPAVPDDFDWPRLEAFLHRLGFEADHSVVALDLYRLLTAVQRIAYREAAGRNTAWPATRLNPAPGPAPGPPTP
ncbi:hypothetical protein ACIRS1_12805 [Kitasatospora sp. NPDC101176]|uniref:hypothetical protein n=1 Tax=Kitasatospora sp. NPDC101176 TaxID=3364099 RepID=UPI00382F94A8